MFWILNSLSAIITSNLFVSRCVLPITPSNQYKLVFNCFDSNSSDFLSELRILTSLQEVCLKGFVFNGENVIEISKCFVNLQIKTISFVECNINDRLISCFEFPDSLRSIHLERLGLSSKGIQTIIDKLPSSIESIKIIKWFGKEPITQHVSLSLAQFSSLKEFQLRNDGPINFSICCMLISLSNISLEIIKMSRIHLSYAEWKYVLQEWNYSERNSIFNSLQVFDVETYFIDINIAVQLIQFFLTFPFLKVLCFEKNRRPEQISLPQLPSQLRQFMLSGFEEVFLNDFGGSIYNSQHLSGLTHLSVCGQFKTFPYELFKLSQLEYLDMCNAKSNQIIFHFSTRDSFVQLKHLAIQAYLLYPLLAKFNSHFPSIKSLSLYTVYARDFDCHLSEILSSKTLKHLEVNYSSYSNDLSLKEGLISLIEELELNHINWNSVSYLIQTVKFPNLKTIILNVDDSKLDIDEVFGKLSLVSQLSSLTLSCTFLSRERGKEFSFVFPNLTFFHLNCHDCSCKLDHLFNYMPNLIEFKINAAGFQNFGIQSTVNIRYLSLPLSCSLESADIFINFIKTTPNLMEFTNDSNFNGLLLSSDLIFYLNILKKYLGNELKFKIQYYCPLIYLLRKDSDLLKLVQSKSSKVANYLERTYQLSKYKDTFLEFLFTNGIPDYFDSLIIEPTVLVKIVQLLFELGRKTFNYNDILFMEEILQADERDYDFELAIEPIEYSLDHFYLSFVNYLQRKTKIKFNSGYFNFTKEYITANKHISLIIISRFLEHYFSSLLNTNKTVNPSVLGRQHQRNLTRGSAG